MRSFKSVLLAAVAIPVLAAGASAANRTWQNPAVNSNFNTAGNWSGGVAPVAGDIAIFNTSDTPVINFTANQTLQAMRFLDGSSNYTFGFAGAFDLEIENASITRDSGAGTVHFNVNVLNSRINFNTSASASNGPLPVTYGVSNGGQVNFFFNSSAGNAVIGIGENGSASFNGTSTAGTAAITVQNAANAILEFIGSSSAGSATITNNERIAFFDTSTAGSSSIVNNDTLVFEDSSTAGSSTITTNNGASTTFIDTTSGGTSRQIVNAGGTLDISGLTSGGTTFGSVEGAGAFVLGAKNATVGGNNHSFAPLVNGERAVTFSGVISGAGGSITKTGTGTWILTGANTYDFGTTIGQGVLQVSADNNLGGAAGAVTFTGGTLRVTSPFTTARNMTATSAARIDVRDPGENFIVSGIISGAGGLVKSGSGQLILTGTNTYTNGTQVLAGSLQMGNGGAVGVISGPVAVSEGAQFVINRNAAVTFAGNISGQGAFGNSGVGNVTLTGNNTYSGNTFISSSGNIIATGTSIGDSSDIFFNGSGALVLNANETVGSINGSGGPITLNNNTLVLAGGFVDPATYGGVISGAGGSLVKNGAFTQILSGASTYSGGTTINGGTLLVNGSIQNQVNVNVGATLGGNGFVNGSVISDSGNVSPGNSPGILTIAGDYTAFGSPTLTVDVFANQVNAPVNGTTHDLFDIGDDVSGANTRILLDFSANSDAPVATTGNGIEIVRVDDESETDDFFLSTAVQSTQNGFIGGFQYLVNALQGSGPGGSDQFFLRTVVREELVANATILAAGRQLTRDCFRGPEHSQGVEGKGDGRAWVNGRYGSFNADPSTGADFDSDYYCVTGGVDAAVGEGFSVGLRGGYASQEVDLSVVQGVANLDGDTWTIEGALSYANAKGYYSGLTFGYQSTEWDYDHALASGGVSSVDVDGVIGSLYAGYRYDLGGNSTLGFEGAVLYDATDCDVNCFLAGTQEDTSDWEGRLAARYDATWGSIKPYAILSFTHNFEGGQRVWFGNAASEIEAANALLGVNLGLQADLGQGWTLTAEAATTQGLDSDVDGYQGLLGLRKTW